MNQLDRMLIKFDWLFSHWGKLYPAGFSKGDHLYSDDIAQSARIAYAKAFEPHCEIGLDHCKSATNKTELVQVTAKNGTAIINKVPKYNESGNIITDSNGNTVFINKPLLRLKRTFSPSCENSAVSALSAAKYAAKESARTFTRHGLKETVFSSDDMTGDLVGYLEKSGINPVTYANEIGLSSAWEDCTIAKLKAETSFSSVANYLESEGLSQFEDIRLRSAFKKADQKGLLGIFLESAFGYNYSEIAGAHGISESCIKKQISRFKKSIGGHVIA